MLNDIYNQKILELAGNIPRLGRLDEPHATSRQHSKLCGSTVVVDLAMVDGKVMRLRSGRESLRIRARRRRLSSPVTSSEPTAEELRGVRDSIRAMLKSGGTPPGGALV